jgi:spermidine synthase
MVQEGERVFSISPDRYLFLPGMATDSWLVAVVGQSLLHHRVVECQSHLEASAILTVMAM